MSSSALKSHVMFKSTFFLFLMLRVPFPVYYYHVPIEVLAKQYVSNWEMSLLIMIKNLSSGHQYTAWYFCLWHYWNMYGILRYIKWQSHCQLVVRICILPQINFKPFMISKEQNLLMVRTRSNVLSSTMSPTTYQRRVKMVPVNSLCWYPGKKKGQITCSYSHTVLVMDSMKTEMLRVQECLI